MSLISTDFHKCLQCTRESGWMSWYSAFISLELLDTWLMYRSLGNPLKWMDLLNIVLKREAMLDKCIRLKV